MSDPTSSADVKVTRKPANAGYTIVSLLVALGLGAGSIYAIEAYRKPEAPLFAFLTKSAAEPGRVRVTEASQSGGASRVSRIETGSNPDAARLAQTADATWVAAAPGRVEPRSGETRLAAQAAGRVVDVLVELNEIVSAGDLLVRIDDGEATARLEALRAEMATRKRERDLETPSLKLATDRRKAEDDLSDAERAAFAARLALDELIVKRHAGTQNKTDVDAARTRLSAAMARIADARTALDKASSAAGLPLRTRLESGLAAARAELALAELAVERHRLRAPVAGSVLEVNAKAGEMVAPSGPVPQVVIGDLSGLRVRAEVEERDLAKVKTGQRVIVKSTAFESKVFEGTVASIAPALGKPRLAARGPRKPNDVDVLEVVIEVDGLPPLKPGMRVDVFFKPDTKVKAAAGGRVVL